MLSTKSNFAASFPEIPQRLRSSKLINFYPSTANRELDSASTPLSHETRSAQSTIASGVSPWLSSWLYPLSHHCFLPYYFQNIRIVGQEHLPKDGAVILAPTHRSRWDALLVPYAAGKHVTGRHLRYMVTADEMKGLQGWFIQHIGGFPIDTRTPGISSLRHGIELLHQHNALVIFPEGGELLENRRKGLNRLHPGLARLAIQAMATQPNCAVRVIPMAINYMNIQDGDPKIDRCEVEIQIGQAIEVAKYIGDHPKRDAKLLTQDLSTALRYLSYLPCEVSPAKS
jgi:1-acyl-sn-glycerol-3-phosphate acyltransferase